MIQTYLIAAVGSLTLAIGAYFYGLHTGKTVEREVWRLAEAQRSEVLREALIESQQELHERTLRVNELARQNAEQREENRGLSDEVRRLIDRAPTVRTVVREVAGECPLPDISLDYWLHNCAIRPGACAGLSDPVAAGGGNDSMR